MTSAGAVVRTLTLTGGTSAVSSTSTLSLAGAFTAKSGSVYKMSVNLPMTVTLNSTKRLHPRPSPVHTDN